MVHVTQENIALIDVDLLVSECIKANRNQEAFAYILSPFMADFKIPWPLVKFASNLIDITDVEFYSDVISVLRQSSAGVKVVTHSPNDLSKTELRSTFVDRQAKFIEKLRSLQCEVRIHKKLHAKATVTSQGAVTGSFNLTPSGRFFNLEEGNFFTNSEGREGEYYREKLNWAVGVFTQSRPVTDDDTSLSSNR